MIFPATDRKRLALTCTFSVDPADFTLVLLVDGLERACEWTAPATGSGSKWSRTARTTARFRGPDATAQDGDVLLSKGAHVTKMRASNGDTTVTALTDLIYCR